MKKYGDRTKEVHAGQENPDPATGARAVPIYQTSSYVFDSAEYAANIFLLKEPGHIYTRLNNPTNDVLEERVAAVEGGVGGLACASGMAAIATALLTIVEGGQEIVSGDNLYGGTYTLFKNTFAKWGIKVNFVDSQDLNAFEEAINENTIYY